MVLFARLMKYAYLEMAVVLASNANKLKEKMSTEQPRAASETPPTTREGRAPKLGKKQSAKEKDRKEKKTREKNKELETEMRAAWAAIRSAGMVSSAQYSIAILSGYPEVTASKITENTASSVPTFALFDILGTDDVIKNPENEAFIGKDDVVAMGTTINNSNRVQVTWLHLLGYLSILRRQCSYAALGVHSDDGNSPKTGRALILPLFSMNKVLKLSKMHSFLRKELSPYAVECCSVLPPVALTLYSSSSTPQMVVTQPSQTDITSAVGGDDTSSTGE